MRGMRLASRHLVPIVVPVLASQERDPAVADQFLKGETMTVHQVKAAASKLQPQQEVEQQSSSPGKRG